MASATLGQLGPRFGIGTNVSAYVRSTNWQGGVLSGAPSGAATAGPVAVGTDGSVTFSGLASDTEYVIYAGSPDRYTSFRTGAGGASGGAQDVEITQPLPAGTNAIGTVDTELPTAAAISDSDTNPTVPYVAAATMLWDNSTTFWKRSRTAAQFLDASPGSAFPVAMVGLWNGAAWDRQRAASIFKSFATTAITAGTGATIWTPAAGKKFRVLGLQISTSVTGQLILGDNAVGTVIARSPSLAAGGIWLIGVGDLLNGILSAAANNVLKLDGPTGNVMGMVWGTEE